MRLFKQLWHQYSSVLAYLIFGGLTTLVNILVFGVANFVLPYWLANVLAWFVSVLFAYFTNRRWVFTTHATSRRAQLREMASFFWYRALSLGIDELIMIIGVSLLGGNQMLVKLIDQVVVVILNWFFSKLFIFKERP